MTQVIEPLRTRACLHSFRCGVNEIDKFCKTAYTKHSKANPKYRVRVLYEGDAAVGMYTLSMMNPTDNGRVLDSKSIYAGTSVFLYLDHLAVAESRRGEGASTKLMADLIENLNGTLETFGSVFAVALNAVDSSAERFFKRWGFVKVSTSTTPFMVMGREDVLRLWREILAES